MDNRVVDASGDRLLQGSVYTDDDGKPDAALAAQLVAFETDPTSYPRVLAALADARLIVPVVALLGEVEYDDAGLARDKSSDMAAVLMTGADGRRALMAFTGTEAMVCWDSQARPVPVAARLAAQTAVQEGAAALVVDLAGPVRFVLEGDDLLRIAQGWRPLRLEDGSWAWLGAEAAIDTE